jgi:hypothetical protein
LWVHIVSSIHIHLHLKDFLNFIQVHLFYYHYCNSNLLCKLFYLSKLLFRLGQFINRLYRDFSIASLLVKLLESNRRIQQRSSVLALWREPFTYNSILVTLQSSIFLTLTKFNTFGGNVFYY